MMMMMMMMMMMESSVASQTWTEIDWCIVHPSRCSWIVLAALLCCGQGIAPEKRAGAVENKIEEMGLRQYADRPAGGYSGGNRRKLSVAMAMIGDPQVWHIYRHQSVFPSACVVHFVLLAVSSRLLPWHERNTRPTDDTAGLRGFLGSFPPFLPSPLNHLVFFPS